MLEDYYPPEKGWRAWAKDLANQLRTRKQEQKMSNPRKRKNFPPNPYRLVSLSPEETEFLLPIKPDWALAGICLNPRSGGVIMHIREDGLPEENPSLGGGRLYIQIEESPEQIAEIANDINEYFKSRGTTKFKVGFIDSSEAPRIQFAK